MNRDAGSLIASSSSTKPVRQNTFLCDFESKEDDSLSHSIKRIVIEEQKLLKSLIGDTKDEEQGDCFHLLKMLSENNEPIESFKEVYHKQPVTQDNIFFSWIYREHKKLFLDCVAFSVCAKVIYPELLEQLEQNPEILGQLIQNPKEWYLSVIKKRSNHES